MLALAAALRGRVGHGRTPRIRPDGRRLTDRHPARPHRKSSQTVHHTTVTEEEAPPPETDEGGGLHSEAELCRRRAAAAKSCDERSGELCGVVRSGICRERAGQEGRIDCGVPQVGGSEAGCFRVEPESGIAVGEGQDSPMRSNFCARRHNLNPPATLPRARRGRGCRWRMCSRRRSRRRPLLPISRLRRCSRRIRSHTWRPGCCLRRQNKFADAEQEYKQALALDPSSFDAVTGLANIYMHGRRFPEAETELRKVVTAHPE